MDRQGRGPDRTGRNIGPHADNGNQDRPGRGPPDRGNRGSADPHSRGQGDYGGRGPRDWNNRNDRRGRGGGRFRGRGGSVHRDTPYNKDVGMEKSLEETLNQHPEMDNLTESGPLNKWVDEDLTNPDEVHPDEDFPHPDDEDIENVKPG